MANLLGKLFATSAPKVKPLKEMKDILILEDDSSNQERMIKQIPAGLTYFLANDGQEFEMFFEENNKARVYFLDNQVPDILGNKGFHFLKHCNYLLKHDPNAIVFYQGAASWDPDIIDYCEEHGVKMINREYPWFRLAIKNGLKDYLKRNSKDVSKEDSERISRAIEEIKE